jgi:hypothetical protein
MHGNILFECYIPRMGKRVDTVLILRGLILVLEFKVGATHYDSSALDQVVDYALDLKNFHEGSHARAIVPILVATNAPAHPIQFPNYSSDQVAEPLKTNAADLCAVILRAISSSSFPEIDFEAWTQAGYRPTPTIVEAAQMLYQTHSVADISRSDAGAKNLRETTASVEAIIDGARCRGTKTICFVNGVPGSGKTLAGLNIAMRRSEEHQEEHAVFLSGNGPLVDVLREALARDKVNRDSVPKTQALREVRTYIQNVHHFRDQYLNSTETPVEKVVVFDEAQRAWTRKQTAAFMQRKRGQDNFDLSEPEFLISVMDRHADWCTVVCLIGAARKSITGEAGISEWIHALTTRFKGWEVHVSPRIELPEYSSNIDIRSFLGLEQVHTDENLHLSVSLRSFRAEALSDFIGELLDNNAEQAKRTYTSIRKSYPLYVTRDLSVARQWLRQKSRGTERFGLVASSGAMRLRPEGIYIKAEINPPNWFLNSKTDIRSAFYLEDVASEFDVQGLELDWVGVCWDGDLHHNGQLWVSQAFKGTKWQAVADINRRLYLKNAYRVLLTRARQGMIIFVPYGDQSDPTRPAAFYDETFRYLVSRGIEVVPSGTKARETEFGR